MSKKKNNWYFIVIVITLATILASYIFLKDWKISILLGIISGIIALIYNPATRYMRAFWASFSTLITLNTFSLNFLFSFTNDNAEGFIKSDLGNTSIFLSIALFILCVVLVILDFLERGNKNKSNSIQNVYHISGDLVKGNKETNNKSEITSEKKDSNVSNTILDIGNINGKPNPYFIYKDNSLDFNFTVNSVGDSIGHIISTTLTMVHTNEVNEPIDFKIFRMRNLPDDYLIYKGKLLSFGQKAGNLPEAILNNLYIVIDVLYTNESKNGRKKLRQIYSIDSKYNQKKIPEASGDEYETINKYLAEGKNTLGKSFDG